VIEPARWSANELTRSTERAASRLRDSWELDLLAHLALAAGLFTLAASLLRCT
jgi:hypothetical protein